MSKLLRYFSPEQSYFVTSVTYERKPILNRYPDLLLHSIRRVREKCNFELIAWIILPDHFHGIINPHDNNLSHIMKRIKLSFAYHYRNKSGLYRGKIWQSRFWDHVIRSREDMNRHMDYIHYNPVKHGLIHSPFGWQQSSIHHFKSLGFYQSDWGVKETLIFADDFGE